MTSRTVILNAALRALGEPPMVGPDDTTSSVQRVSEAYVDAVPSLLARHPWNFAMAVVQLSGTTDAKPGWLYAYPKPADCLRIVRVSMTDQPDDVGLRYVDSAGEVLTDQLNPYLRYVSDTWIDRLGSWPTLFQDAVVAQVAADAGPVLSKGEGALERLRRDAKDAMRQAKSWDAQQQPNYQLPPGRFIRVRTGRGWGSDYGPY